MCVPVGQEENINNVVLTKEHMKTTNQSKVLLALAYGEPTITRLEIDGGILHLEVLVPGVIEKSMIIAVDEDKIMVEHEVDDRFVGKFKFFLSPASEGIVFDSVECQKDNGLLIVTAHLRQVKNNEPVIYTL